MNLDMDIMRNDNGSNGPESAHLEFCFMNCERIGIWFYCNNVLLFLCHFFFIQWPLAHLQRKLSITVLSGEKRWCKSYGAILCIDHVIIQPHFDNFLQAPQLPTSCT